MDIGIVTAVGVWFYCAPTKRLLYLMRSGAKHAYTWGLPGGKSQSNETLLDTIQRECHEEIGFMPLFSRIYPLEQFTTDQNRFVYHTFFCLVDSEFSPRLNHEHIGYAWLQIGIWPKPMHPGLWNTINLEEIMKKISVLTELSLDVAERHKISHAQSGKIPALAPN